MQFGLSDRDKQVTYGSESVEQCAGKMEAKMSAFSQIHCTWAGHLRYFEMQQMSDEFAANVVFGIC